MASLKNLGALTLLLLLLSLTVQTWGKEDADGAGSECRVATEVSEEKASALKLKVIAIFTILIASILGISSPILLRGMPLFKPDGKVFVLVKAFASGVILATGYVHVLPDSFECLTSPCLPDYPWSKFPFTTFIAMVAAVLTLMVDSFAMSYYRKHGMNEVECEHGNQIEHRHGHGHSHGVGVKKLDEEASKLLRYQIIAQVLELGIVVHSVVIGLSMGASQNARTIRPLIAAICFHQLFEGVGLGGCLLQAEYKAKMKAIMVFFFSVTTPFGIALGIGLSHVYSDNSPASLIVVGVLNATSGGLLNYMALVDLLAADFMGAKLQSNMKLQMWAFIAVLLGVSGMSLMAKWA
ncbi:fe(2+) transport protein 1-like [Vitis riparia]|uniref:fe(2+) transport protein 1-like n=1 Tax=Vitis riparia TaxID=96939 RepID=UPI00155B027B|nr:fe(2+) transport protein 1-like [Vitis riparia]